MKSESFNLITQKRMSKIFYSEIEKYFKDKLREKYLIIRD